MHSNTIACVYIINEKFTFYADFKQVVKNFLKFIQKIIAIEQKVSYNSIRILYPF